MLGNCIVLSDMFISHQHFAVARNFNNFKDFFGSAVSSAGFIICLLGISKLHHCTQIYLFLQECDAFQKKNTCLNQKLDIQHSSLLLFKPHRFLGISQNALFLRISQNALSLRNVLERTIILMKYMKHMNPPLSASNLSTNKKIPGKVMIILFFHYRKQVTWSLLETGNQ